MLCCFGRPKQKFSIGKHSLQEENWVPTPIARVENNSPVPSTTNSDEEKEDKVSSKERSN